MSETKFHTHTEPRQYYRKPKMLHYLFAVNKSNISVLATDWSALLLLSKILHNKMQAHSVAVLHVRL
jgi:hypothetical protein